MVFDLGMFVAGPSVDYLEECRKADLFAKHYNVHCTLTQEKRLERD